ncbi:MAG: DUF2283 domain-containing protein [Armatimonadetes bacterium]|nr:DUF2283 domain-containing protein [Anaerolineae bacterium]
MQSIYDHEADALYITLSAKTHSRTQRITHNFILDFDEAGEVCGIEVLNVMAAGINPLELNIAHYTAQHQPAALTDAEKAAYQAGVERRQQRVAQHKVGINPAK